MRLRSLSAFTFCALAALDSAAHAAPDFPSVQIHIPCVAPGAPIGDQGRDCSAWSGTMQTTRITFYTPQINPLFVETKVQAFTANAIDAFLDGNGDAATFATLYTGTSSILLDTGLRVKIEVLDPQQNWLLATDVPYRPSAGYAVRAVHSDDTPALEKKLQDGLSTQSSQLTSYVDKQIADEAAARIRCTNNLKQLGLALHNYEGVNKAFPPGRAAYPIVVSAQGRILAYVEQDVIGRLMDVNMVPMYNSNVATYPLTPGNYQASITPVKLFVCPSDPMGGQNPSAFATTPSGAVSTTDLYAGLNYVTCIGSGDGSADNTGTWWGQYKTSDGMFGQVPVPVAGVTDGLSNTAAFSESTMGDGSPDAGAMTSASRQVLTLSGSTVTSDANCAGGGTWSNMRGAKWINGHYADANYNHHLLPNDKRWDCSNASHNPGQAAARSNHTGGVNLLLGDGSVRFVRSAVDPVTWRALGTRAGNETLGDF